MQVEITELFPRPTDRWNHAVADTLSGREEVIFRSHLVGADPALTKEGGGNFSAKGMAKDHRGRWIRVLWMSAWGCDGAITTSDDFPALRLDDLCAVRDSGPMTETEMVEYLLASGLYGEQRRPGIETLTHAFIPAAHVDHCHPDAVIALTSFPEGRARAAEEFGDEAIWFDYRQFDVDVARELTTRIAANPRCRFVLLANHGLFTWADSSEQCYRNSLEAVERATRALEKAMVRRADLGGRAVVPLPPDTATAVLADILPTMRGELLADNPGVVLHIDGDTRTREFTASVRGPALSLRGPGCPDHLGTVGFRPLVLEPVRKGSQAARKAITEGVSGYREWHRAYYERHVGSRHQPPDRGGDSPRVIVLPGIGTVSSGPDAARARLCADHFRQTMTVIQAADAAGGYLSLTEAQGAADEYWPLIRHKPQLRPAAGRLSRKVFLVAGSDDTQLGDLAARLATADAHVALLGTGADTLATWIHNIISRCGERRAVALRGTPDQPDHVVREAVLQYGGFDIVIDLTPSHLLAPAALPVLAQQGRGGSVILVGNGRGDELPGRVAALSRDAAVGVTVNAIDTDDPEAISQAVTFLASSELWNGTVLEPRIRRETNR
jgi:rhamnose utilization protein RhaD (predicted bifunctional aldolase and dehydrogenase)